MVGCFVKKFIFCGITKAIGSTHNTMAPANVKMIWAFLPKVRIIKHIWGFWVAKIVSHLQFREY